MRVIQFWGPTMHYAYKLTYVLLVLVIAGGTVCLSTRESRAQGAVQTERLAKWKERQSEAKRNFPTADFNEADPVDPVKRNVRKQKQKRHNGLGLVHRNLGPDSGGA